MGKIAIVEKMELVKVAMMHFMESIGFEVVLISPSVVDLIARQRNNDIVMPDICILDTATEYRHIQELRSLWPSIKIIAYDPMDIHERPSALLSGFDLYIGNTVEMNKWASLLGVMIC